MEFNEKELHIIPLSLVKVSNSIEVFLVEGRPDLFLRRDRWFDN